MAKREKTYWAIKKSNGGFCKEQVLGGRIPLLTPRKLDAVRCCAADPRLRPVRVKLVEVE